MDLNYSGPSLKARNIHEVTSRESAAAPRFMLKSLALIAAVAFTFAFSSCSDSDEHPNRSLSIEENTLRYDVAGPILSFDPMKENASAAMNSFQFLYSYLFIPNRAGEMEPDLAVTWSYDSECTWTIELRNDALFHNGKVVTSRDVTYSLSGMLRNSLPSLYAIVQSITPLTETTVRIVLHRDDPDFIKKIACLEIVPEPGEDPIDYYNHPIGSGPFKFGYRRGEDEAFLVANEDYYAGRPALDRVAFFHIPDKEKSWTRLFSGKTDIAQGIYPADYRMMKDNADKLYFDTTPSKFYSILLYNTAHPLLSDPRVRRAMTHAIDRESIIRDILNGFAVVASGPMGADSPYHNPEVGPLAYDPRKSIELLNEAGWSFGGDGHYLEKEGRPFEVTIIWTAGNQIDCSVVEYIQFYLNEIGVKALMKPVPTDELVRRFLSNDEFEAVLTQNIWAYDDAYSLKHHWCPTADKTALSGSFNDPGVCGLFDDAATESDPQKKKEFYHRVDGLIASLQPGTFLFHRTSLDVMSMRIVFPFEFALDFLGHVRLKHAAVKPK